MSMFGPSDYVCEITCKRGETFRESKLVPGEIIPNQDCLYREKIMYCPYCNEAIFIKRSEVIL